MEFWIWIAILIVVAILKSLGKGQSEQAPKKPTSPPVIPQRPRPARPRPQPSQHPARPAMQPSAPKPWQAEPSTLREFIEQVSRHAQPRPAAASPPPRVKRAMPVAKEPPRPQPKPVAPPSPAPGRPKRASQLVEALHDRKNLRNIIIGSEIIGPPKGV